MIWSVWYDLSQVGHGDRLSILARIKSEEEVWRNFPGWQSDWYMCVLLGFIVITLVA